MSQKYGSALWLKAGVVVILLPQIIWVVGMAYIFGLFTSMFFRNLPDRSMLALVVMACILPALLGHVFICVIAGGNTVASFVSVSPQGLEIRNWPFYRLLLNWGDIQWSGGAKRWGRNYGMIRLAGAQELPEGRITTALSKAFRRFRGGIGLSYTLNTIQGYHHGEFADQLRHYAPHLFD